VFHGLSPDDPPRKIAAFREIVQSVPSAASLTFESGPAGRIGESSSYFQWLTVRQ
jgi:hypothetical protein